MKKNLYHLSTAYHMHYQRKKNNDSCILYSSLTDLLSNQSICNADLVSIIYYIAKHKKRNERLIFAQKKLPFKLNKYIHKNT